MRSRLPSYAYTRIHVPRSVCWAGIHEVRMVPRINFDTCFWHLFPVMSVNRRLGSLGPTSRIVGRATFLSGQALR